MFEDGPTQAEFKNMLVLCSASGQRVELRRPTEQDFAGSRPRREVLGKLEANEIEVKPGISLLVTDKSAKQLSRYQHEGALKHWAIMRACQFGSDLTATGEILPLRIREKGLALGNILYWLFQFMMVEITPIALTSIGYKFYILLAALNFAIALIVYFFWVETKGLSLEEIDFKFAGTQGEAPARVDKHEAGVSVQGQSEHHEVP